MRPERLIECSGIRSQQHGASQRFADSLGASEVCYSTLIYVERLKVKGRGQTSFIAWHLA
jgi:hypothetical protein